MRLAAFIFSTLPLMIERYAERYKQIDLSNVLGELEEDLNLPKIRTYDFIVVGGGTAGCIVARRLSEGHDVLLLEAGGNPVPASYSPAVYPFVEKNHVINNQFYSVPQKHAGLEREGILLIQTGRMMGGSGSHNADVYNRGNPKDFDHYAQLTGDHSWRYDLVVEHFKNIERFQGDLINKRDNTSSSFYGTDGLLSIKTDLSEPLQAWLLAGKEAQFQTIDPNLHNSEGFAPEIVSQKNGEKVSTYAAFIKPIEGKRKSLTIHKYSHAERVLLDDQKVAYGVVYKRHDMPQIAHASKEVIISAGAFSTPLILMKSGIGPKDVLQEAKIPIKHELPGVGSNLRDHVGLSLLFSMNEKNAFQYPHTDEEVQEQLRNYHSGNKHGFYSHSGNKAQAFIQSKSSKARGDSNYPDIQFELTMNVMENFQDGPRQGKTVAINVIINRINSIGTVRLNTTAFLQGEVEDTRLTLIDHRFLEDNEDVEVFLEGVKMAVHVMEETAPFKEMQMTYDQDQPKDCKHLQYKSDAYWKCLIHQKSRWWYHAVGTCKMGKRDDPMSVVDSKLRLVGVKNLRIVDASIFPHPPNTNTNAGTMVVAEKATSEILKHLNSKY